MAAEAEQRKWGPPWILDNCQRLTSGERHEENETVIAMDIYKAKGVAATLTSKLKSYRDLVIMVNKSLGAPLQLKQTISRKVPVLYCRNNRTWGFVLRPGLCICKKINCL